MPQSLSEVDVDDDIVEFYVDSRKGGKIFLGTLLAASDRELLGQLGITRIANCQDVDRKICFPEDPEIVYLAFPIGHYFLVEDSLDASQGTAAFFKPMNDFVHDALREGRSVLLHDLGGAQRCGAASMALLILLEDNTAAQAQQVIEALRHQCTLELTGLKDLLNALQICRPLLAKQAEERKHMRTMFEFPLPRVVPISSLMAGLEVLGPKQRYMKVASTVELRNSAVGSGSRLTTE